MIIFYFRQILIVNIILHDILLSSIMIGRYGYVKNKTQGAKRS